MNDKRVWIGIKHYSGKEVTPVKYTFLANIINKNWFRNKAQAAEQEWTFQGDLEILSVEQFERLVSLLSECIEVKVDEKIAQNMTEAVRFGHSYPLGDLTIDKEFMVKFLICITLAEYVIDDLLLHPQEMRKWEFQQICDSVGLPKDLVMKIYKNWHSGIRQKIFGEYR